MIHVNCLHVIQSQNLPKKCILNIMTTSFHISNVFERKLQYYRLLKEMSMNNLSQISTTKLTELKISR